MIVESTVKYLIAIYRLTRVATVASTKVIAEELGYSRPSVTRKIQSLAKDDYLYYEHRKGVSLTKKGERAALRGMRRLRLLETFLVHTLNYPQVQAKIEASQMEHSVSDMFLDQVEELLE